MPTRLPYRILFLFVIFFVMLAAPFTFIQNHDAYKMIERMDHAQPLSQEQRTAFSNYIDGIYDNLIFLSFYIFIIAFVLSIFFARTLLSPVRELFRGVEAIRDGNIEARLDIVSTDELGSLSKAFNEMAEAIRKRELGAQRIRRYVEVQPDPLWAVDDEGAIIDINNAFTRQFGHERDDVIGTSFYELLDEDSEKQIRRRLYEASHESPASYNVSVLSRVEGMVPVRLTIMPLAPDDPGAGSIILLRDTRPEAELARQAEEAVEGASAVMDAMIDQVLVLGSTGVVQSANMSARVFHGQDVRGAMCHEFFCERRSFCGVDEEDCPIKQVINTGKPLRTVHEHKSASNGKKLWFDVTAVPVRDRFGDFKRIVLSLRDISERIRFETEIDHKNRELSAINAISRLLSRSLRSEDIYREVLESIMGLFGMSGGGIYLLDDTGRVLELAYSHGLGAEFKKSIGRLRLGEDIPGRAALNNQPFYSADIALDRRVEQTAFRHTGIRALACAPIRGKEKLIGVFFVFSVSEKLFSSGDEGIMSSVSEIMGISFENIRLYERMRGLYEQDKQRKGDEQKTLLKLASMMGSTMDMRSALDESLLLIRSSCWADFVWMLERSEGGTLTLKASTEEEDMPPGTAIYPTGVQNLEHEAMEKREPAIIRGLTSEGRLNVSRFVRAYTTACAIPMLLGDRVIGAFTLYYTADATVDEDELHFLRIVASMLAVSMERARLYENVVIQRGMAETILDSIADGVATIDPGGRVISINRAAAKILGVPVERTAGRHVDEIVGRETENLPLKVKMHECFDAALSGRAQGAEASFVTPGGARFPLALRGAPVYNNLGGIVGAVFVIRDLSAEREADMLKTDFVKSVSHEFRTPLTAIVGMSEMLLDGEVDNEKRHQYMETVLSEARRLSRMVADVLDVARIESGKLTLEGSLVVFDEVFADAAGLNEQAARARDISVTFKSDPALAGWVADVEKIKQMLRHLIENSITYSDRGGRVEVEARRDGDRVAITVSDTGWGIGEDELPHLGEKFFRGSAVANTTKGTGLGLALCKEIARLHGGSLKIVSAQGKGTSVTVDMPLRRNS